MLRKCWREPSDSLVAVRKWALLIVAIAIEVAATLSLRASQDHSAWLVVVVVGYAGALVLLTMVLRAGMPVGVSYGIWGASGTALTAVLAAAIFGDPFTWPIVAGIALIIAGVLLVDFGSRPAGADQSTP
jgi:small multidrug resistance pump